MGTDEPTPLQIRTVMNAGVNEDTAVNLLKQFDSFKAFAIARAIAIVGRDSNGDLIPDNMIGEAFRRELEEIITR